MAINNSLVKVEDLPDGSTVYELNSDENGISLDDISSVNFNENLAETLDSSELERIAAQLFEEIKQDKESRVKWEKTYIDGIKYLGFELEFDQKVPFIEACRAFDTTLSTALIRFYATARAELFPQKGPVECEIIGYPDNSLDQHAERIKTWLNYYLTEEDKEYYKDSERLLIYLGIVGCAFRKVYIDPLTNKPISRFIDPQDFIVNNSCTSILSSNRLTHVLSLSKKEIKLRQQTGFYRDITLKGITDNEDNEDTYSQAKKTISKIEGIQTSSYEHQSIFKIFEVHTDLVLEDKTLGDDSDVIPRPYILALCESSRKILSIRRNWVEGDPLFKRKNCFIQYNYLPGLGLYGLGLSHILGSNSVALTSILRQLIDAGTLKNFPGGLRVKGLRIETNNKNIGPGEFLEVDTGGLPIQQAVMPMPYSEPSQVLNTLRNELIQQTQNLSLTPENQISESKSNAPVGTTLALLEISNLVQSSVLRSLHVSLTNELQMLYELFRHSNNSSFSYPDKQGMNVLNQNDLLTEVRVLPVSDPSINTSSHRLVKAISLIDIASKAPQLYDMRQIHLRACQAMKIENIDEILPNPQEILPLDPITTVMNAMQGKPVKAAMWQNHPAYITVLAGADPQAQNPGIQALIKEHQAMQYSIEMQASMQIQLPPAELLQDPTVQNEIAVRAAYVVQQQQIQMQQMLEQQQQEQQPQIDQSTLMLADIQQQQEIANVKAEAELIREHLKGEVEKYKADIQKMIADQKNMTDLTIQQMKAEVDLIKDRSKGDLNG